jgi:formylglycine-generating enzyme required for sulfatase activity
VHDPPAARVTAPQWEFAMGDAFAEGDASELPVHPVRLSPFRLDATAVTNDEFAAFVAATGHVTDAERYGSSAVFQLLADPEADVAGVVPGTPWWLNVRGATWRSPEGGASTVDGRDAHPVVHVSWSDAAAYAAWAGRRLPTEAEWEHAARGGLAGKRYPWGDELQGCNIFRGDFPDRPAGRLGTVAAAAGPPNGYGLRNLVGNVWEWCADWFSATYYGASPRDDPAGPAAGSERVMRGGSYLCHDSYCRRYRVAARTSNTPDSSAGNLGFRCAIDCAPGGEIAP